MIERHFAFFSQETGTWMRGWRGPVADPPNINGTVPESERLGLLNAWATAVSEPGLNEIGLDVTETGFSVEDMRWSRFNHVTRTLELTWRAFIELDADGRVVQAFEATRPNQLRPIAGTTRLLEARVPGHVVVDITGLHENGSALLGHVLRRPNDPALTEADPDTFIDMMLCHMKETVPIITKAGEL